MEQVTKENYASNCQTVAPSFRMKDYHYHNCWELFFLISGNCTVHYDNAIYHIESGGIILIPQGSPHMTTYLSGCVHKRHVLYFTDTELEWLSHQLQTDVTASMKDHFVVRIPAKHISYVADLMDKITYEHNGIDQLSPAFDRAYFYELMLYLIRCKNYEGNLITKMDVSNETIQQVIEYIIHNFSQDITLTDTARLFGMSESSLSKKFKAFTGYRFKEYLVDVRTHAAADMLLNTTLPMTAIADKCGFSDSNSFGNTFKRVWGCSPSTYRREH